MDNLLFDELLHEIIQRLPPSSIPTISLVSKRWLSALHFCTTNLSLSIPHSSFTPLLPSLSIILSHYPNLSSLSILSNHSDQLQLPQLISFSSDSLLLSVAASPCASRLIKLRLVSSSFPFSSSALISSSSSLTNLSNLHLSAANPFSFRWLAAFPNIKSLSFTFTPKSRAPGNAEEEESFDFDDESSSVVMLPLESLCLSGVRAGDRGMRWIWRRCGNLRWLRLRACEGTGDGPSSPFFFLCLASLRALELRSCRAIADRVLLLAADHCRAISSVLVYDGGSSDALLQFISRRAASLRAIDLRLPLDLHNHHLSAIAAASDSPRLGALRLQSCCLVTGDGLRAVASAAAGKGIEELALVNCDVIEREPGLLSFVGQSLPRLQRLDLSYNETLGDKELAAMLCSCASLVEIKLRGCGSLTDSLLLWLVRLAAVDLCRCNGISIGGIELFVVNSSMLSRLSVEKEKISEAAMTMALRRAIQIVD